MHGWMQCAEVNRVSSRLFCDAYLGVRLRAPSSQTRISRRVASGFSVASDVCDVVKASLCCIGILLYV